MNLKNTIFNNSPQTLASVYIYIYVAAHLLNNFYKNIYIFLIAVVRTLIKPNGVMVNTNNKTVGSNGEMISTNGKTVGSNGAMVGTNGTMVSPNDAMVDTNNKTVSPNNATIISNKIVTSIIKYIYKSVSLTG